MMDKNQITDEMLVALADGELSEQEADAVYQSVLEDDELLDKFTSFAETGAILRQSADVLSMDEARDENIVDFQAAKQRFRIPKIFPNVRVMSQMAAALMVGVFVAPSLSPYWPDPLQDENSSQLVAENTSSIQTIEERGRFGGLRKELITRSTEEYQFDIGLRLANGNFLFNGDVGDLKQPFKLMMLSSKSGIVSISEILPDGSKDIWIEDLLVTANKRQEIPTGEQKFFRLSNDSDALVLELRIKSEAGDDPNARLFVFGKNN